MENYTIAIMIVGILILLATKPEVFIVVIGVVMILLLVSILSIGAFVQWIRNPFIVRKQPKLTPGWHQSMSMSLPGITIAATSRP